MQRFTRPWHRTLLFILLLFPAAAARAQTFTDTTFTAGWTTTLHFQSPSIPAVGASANFFPTLGPNSRRLIHNYFGSSAMYVRHMNSLQTYSPSSGQISTIQFSYTLRAASINVGYAPLISQGGQYFSRRFDSATTTSTAFIHTMTANDFWLVRADGRLDETQHPDFSCSGAPITMGYYSGNSNPTAPTTTVISSVSFLSAWRVNIAATPCGPAANPCCPPLTVGSVKDQLRLFQPGTVGSNYGFQIVPLASYAAQFQTYVDYLHSMNPSITALIVTWRVTDQSNNPLPLGPNGPLVTAAISNWACTATGCPPATTNLPFGGLPLVPNRWYRVTATAILNNGLTFWAADCPPAVFEYNMREIP